MAALKCLPLFVYGKVVKGFGRGSKQLGIPTANMCEKAIDSLPEELQPGIYFGLASVDYGPVHNMVMSVGWNPYYHNEKKSMETHILHQFDEDFYGALLKIILIGYIRPEQNFSSIDELIAAIKSDISIAKLELENPTYKDFYSHDFWQFKSTVERGVFCRKFSLLGTEIEVESEAVTNGAMTNGDDTK